MRAAVTRFRFTAIGLLPRLGPNALPVSSGAANGSKPSLVQSSRIAAKVPRDVADQRLQEFIDRDGVRSAGPFDMREILVATKRKLAKVEIAVSKLIQGILR